MGQPDAMGKGQRADTALGRGKGHLRVVGRSDVQHLRAARVLGHGTQAAGDLGGVGRVTAGVALGHRRIGFGVRGDELGAVTRLTRWQRTLGGCTARKARVVDHHHLAGAFANGGQRVLQEGVQHQAVAGHQHFAALGVGLVPLHLATVARVVDEDLVAVLDGLVELDQAIAHAVLGQPGVADLGDVAVGHAHGLGDQAGVGRVQVNARQVVLGVAIVTDPHDQGVVFGMGGH